MAISMGLAKEASVKRICGIPFLMIFKFSQVELLFDFIGFSEFSRLLL